MGNKEKEGEAVLWLFGWRLTHLRPTLMEPGIKKEKRERSVGDERGSGMDGARQAPTITVSGGMEGKMEKKKLSLCVLCICIYVCLYIFFVFVCVCIFYVCERENRNKNWLRV